MTAPIILASTSRYRAELLARFGLAFEQKAPVCDETPLQAEPPDELVIRLSRLKAESVHDSLSGQITIGSDQVANFQGRIIGKPGNHEAAIQQLIAISGKTVKFYTGLHVMRGSECRHDLISTTVQFKELTRSQIERYLHADKPYDCACSFKSESLGSAIVESMTSDDPSALIGLPLVRLAGFINELGQDIP
ncbi:septum formation protein Maf [Chromatiales bacterium (ex Bugula neritina AB1)]|nr:septum formation protein Maf [Chromatiales bacterium (ex Bugula neritina AB1)]